MMGKGMHRRGKGAGRSQQAKLLECHRRQGNKTPPSGDFNSLAIRRAWACAQKMEMRLTIPDYKAKRLRFSRIELDVLRVIQKAMAKFLAASDVLVCGIKNKQKPNSIFDAVVYSMWKKAGKVLPQVPHTHKTTLQSTHFKFTRAQVCWLLAIYLQDQVRVSQKRHDWFFVPRVDYYKVLAEWLNEIWPGQVPLTNQQKALDCLVMILLQDKQHRLTLDLELVKEPLKSAIAKTPVYQKNWCPFWFGHADHIDCGMLKIYVLEALRDAMPRLVLSSHTRVQKK